MGGAGSVNVTAYLPNYTASHHNGYSVNAGEWRILDASTVFQNVLKGGGIEGEPGYW